MTDIYRDIYQEIKLSRANQILKRSFIITWSHIPACAFYMSSWTNCSCDMKLITKSSRQTQKCALKEWEMSWEHQTIVSPAPKSFFSRLKHISSLIKKSYFMIIDFFEIFEILPLPNISIWISTSCVIIVFFNAMYWWTMETDIKQTREHFRTTRRNKSVNWWRVKARTRFRINFISRYQI